MDKQIVKVEIKTDSLEQAKEIKKGIKELLPKDKRKFAKFKFIKLNKNEKTIKITS